MPVRGGRLRMPRIRSISLRNFSLFSKQPNLDLTFGDGVFCLAGANGLGKSTFLATVAYAVTGIVPPLKAKRGFTTVKEYYKSNLKSAPSFFRGRIAPQDMKDALVTVEFVAGPSAYVVTRGFARSNELIGLEIRDSADCVILDTSEWEPKKRHSEYSHRVAADVGLAAFEQLVFLEHMVLAFDERRHLLFWDDRAIEQALYMAFGVDPRHAQAADDLRKEISKHDSLARSTDWEASKLRTQRNSIAANAQGASEEDTAGDALAEYRSLSEHLEEGQDTVSRLLDEVQAKELDFARTSAEYTTLRQEYSEAFSALAQGSPVLAHHPLVRTSLSESRCGLCGTSDAGIADRIRERVGAAECPLCGSRLHGDEPDAKAARRLKQIDRKLAEVQRKVDALGQLRQELRGDLSTAEEALLQAREGLATFEKTYGRPRSDDDSDPLEALLRRYDEQIRELERTKDRYNAVKRQKLRELRPLQQALQRRYSEAEREFVPVFQKLASLFLGLDLGIKMKHREPGVGLILTVSGSERRQLDQLSESQRFFLDIALRMALAQYFSADDSKAQLLIDTPEGSLDIAYESNAGEMLAEFARTGHSIIMSANINTSALLRSLAEKCTSRQMTLCRMTPWAELSEVQKQHERDFDGAYGRIERQLARRRR